MSDSDNEKNNKTTDDSPSTVTPKYNKARRRLLATLGTGGAIGAAASGWVSPVIESVVLPAHATASVTSCTDTDNAGVTTWGAFGSPIGGDYGPVGNSDLDSPSNSASSSTHSLNFTLSDGGNTTGFEGMDVWFGFGGDVPDVSRVNANLNGSLVNGVANVIADEYPVDSDWPGINVSVDSLDTIFVGSDGPGGITVTVANTTGDCSQAYNVTFTP